MAVKNNLKFIFNHFKLNIKKEWQYKTSFLMQVIMMILNDSFFIIQWYVIYQIIDNIGGYHFNETLLLFGIASGAFGIAHTFFYGAWTIKDIVYDGKLDVFLTQPKNVLLNVCCSRSYISAIGDIIYSYIVLIIIGAPWYWYLLMLPIIILSGLIYVSVYVVYASLCFYIKNGDAVSHAVEGALNKAENYPPIIYSLPIKIILFTVIPACFCAFVPAQYILLSFNLWWLLALLGVTLLWVCLAFLCFNLGLKKYNSGNIMGSRM